MRSKIALVIASLLFTASAGAQNLTIERPPGNAAATPLVSVAADPPLPPTVADVVLLLKSYVPDTAKTERLRAEFIKPVPEVGSPFDMAQMWHRKAIVAEELSETQARYDMLNKALVYAQQSAGSSSLNEIGSLKRVHQDLAVATAQTMGLGAGVDAFEKFREEHSAKDAGSTIGPGAGLTGLYLAMGDIDRAKKTLTNMNSIVSNLRTKPWAVNYASTWTTFLEQAQGSVHMAQGKNEDAIRSFLAAERMSLQMVEDSARNRAAGRFGLQQDRAEASRDNVRINLARAYIESQRFNEAELLLRDVLKTALKREGRSSRLVGAALANLSRIYAERGRNPEALALAQWADRTMEEAGLSTISLPRVNTRRGLANLYASNGRFEQAASIFDDLKRIAAADARGGAEVEIASLGMVRAYVGVGRAADALASADRLLASSIKSYGLNDYKTAEVRGFRAMALQKLGRKDEARKEFESAIAVLVDPGKSLGGAESSAFRAQRLQGILNAYLHLLVGPDAQRNPKDTAEAFRIADVVRWQSVQKAVSGSALRSAAGTPELGAKIKTLQDNEDELQAVYKNLIAQRSAPPDKQLPTVIAAMEKRIEAIQKEQAQALADIRRQFPKYDALVNPRPADFGTARQALLPGEALLSIYVTDAGTYVWAAPGGSAGGPDAGLQFHFSPKPKAWLAEQVKRLRDAVDLTTGVSPDRMKFDVEAAHAIYQEFLAPVEGAWAKGDTLLVVANDALGQVPFSMLVTNDAPGPVESSLTGSHYRQTPWLLRKAAISYLPSVSTLVTLRSVASSKAQRSPFIGFGDPDFGQHTSAASVVSRGTRNLKVSQAPKFDEVKLGIDSADSVSTAAQVAAAAVVEVPELAALPDTRDEITAIANALSADLSKDTFFGAQATPQSVISANLKSRRIVAFATHGLVAGDLPGLDQPALALSPAPGKDIYSGLLKLEEVLKLSMDADLVVLSACNTAASDGSGSEAVSGLVRGFFYAGSRSVLATHWPVETVSARQLVTHLFERYSKVEGLSRAKSLQRAMLEVLDKEVAKDGRGTAVNAYAHPAYWAPYALYGDPGR